MIDADVTFAFPAGEDCPLSSNSLHLRKDFRNTSAQTEDDTTSGKHNHIYFDALGADLEDSQGRYLLGSCNYETRACEMKICIW